jgi:hypothetical protein
MRDINVTDNGIRGTFFGTGSRTDTERPEYICTICNISISRVAHYYHMDGNHSNNDISNRQTLCPHAQTESTISFAVRLITGSVVLDGHDMLFLIYQRNIYDSRTA